MRVMGTGFPHLDGRILHDERIEETLRDAAYTAVGLGVMAYALSTPFRRRACDTVERFFQNTFGTQADRSRQ